MPVFDKGDPGDKFYILLHGRLRVFSGDVHLATLDAGEGFTGDKTEDRHGLRGTQNGYSFFGEMALLDGKPRMASVHTLSPCKLLCLSRYRFAKFLALVPDFKARLKRTKELRTKQTELEMLQHLLHDRA